MAGTRMSLLMVLFLTLENGVNKISELSIHSKRVTLVWKHQAWSSCPVIVVSLLFSQGQWDIIVVKSDVSGLWSPL